MDIDFDWYARFVNVSGLAMIVVCVTVFSIGAGFAIGRDNAEMRAIRRRREARERESAFARQEQAEADALKKGYR
jgi:hypothetical protein